MQGQVGRGTTARTDTGAASATLVLIGGSGLGRGLWDRVTPHLTGAGCRVVTPQLRGIDGDPTPPAGVTLTHWVEDVVAALARVSGPCTIVAHSFAAYVVAGVLEGRRTAGMVDRRGVAGMANGGADPADHADLAARADVADRVDSVVMIDAVLPRPGRSWFDEQGEGAEQVMSTLAVGGATPWFTRREIDALYPDHGLTDEDYAWLTARASGQPLPTYAEPAARRPIEDAGVDLALVRCLRTDPPTAPVTAATPGWRYREIDAGHWPMVTAPRATAEVILELVGV